MATPILIQRPLFLGRLRSALRRAPIVALVGPRQCGKTTLARQVTEEGPSSWFDLENPRDDARLQNAQQVLEKEKGLIVIDEIQRRPDLFPLLRVLADRSKKPRSRILILGSASPDLIRHSSESLAGRVEQIEMAGLLLGDVSPFQQDALWLRGGFPKAYIEGKRSNEDSLVWRENFIATFLERDLPQLGIRIPAALMRRFWAMVAHRHGRVWNASDIATSLGKSPPTIRDYLDIMTGAFMVRQLPPWFENLGKRIVKMPKVYIRDSGLLHVLLGIDRAATLQSHPDLGFSWEGFALEQILQRAGTRDAYFWATHAGAELDLLLVQKGKKIGFEFKVSDSPAITKSMRISLQDLKLDELWVVHSGDLIFPLADRVTAMSLAEALRRLQ